MTAPGIPREQFLVDENGTRIAVLLRIEDYEALIERLEDLEDERALEEARREGGPTVPFREAIAESSANAAGIRTNPHALVAAHAHVRRVGCWRQFSANALPGPGHRWSWLLGWPTIPLSAARHPANGGLENEYRASPTAD